MYKKEHKTTTKIPRRKEITDFDDSLSALRLQIYLQKIKHKRDSTKID